MNHELTPAERHVDELLRYENWERYTQQPARTVDGERAELPERARLEAFVSGGSRKTGRNPAASR